MKMVRKLKDFKQRLKPTNENEVAIIGSLLHDIGHGPFSHAFEGMFKNFDISNTNSKADIKKERQISHEDWTPFFLDEILKKTPYSCHIETIQNIITHKHNFKDSQGTNNIAADIITSQLDSDRLDYLLRDSHFCGISYGSIDIKWIINHLVIIKDTDDDRRLGVLRSGWRSVEHFLLSRRLMTQQICFYEKKMVMEKLLIFLLRTLAETINTLSYEIKLDENIKNLLINSSEYIKNQNAIKKDFIQKNYTFYKELTDHDFLILIRELALTDKSNSVSKIAKIIQNRTPHKTFNFNKNNLSAINSILIKLRKDLFCQDWEMFIASGDVMPYENSKDPILVQDETGRVSYFSEYSSIFDIIQGYEETECCLAISRELWGKEGEKIRRSFKKYINFVGTVKKSS